ncbi:hypothetical protein F53441_8598 [Fusarium austroafricanum]|uniref:Uncharacterized protein n=1 Tax=Fusarium austroafricanum TaxID=2364996 RepID=A0A8H4KF84_9HYPO|nr:hypothetical protein F53441_8598 [Fusarium austroafricanum]
MHILKILTPALLMSMPLSLAWDVLPHPTSEADIQARDGLGDEVTEIIKEEAVDAVTGFIVRIIIAEECDFTNIPKVS